MLSVSSDSFTRSDLAPLANATDELVAAEMTTASPSVDGAANSPLTSSCLKFQAVPNTTPENGHTRAESEEDDPSRGGVAEENAPGLESDRLVMRQSPDVVPQSFPQAPSSPLTPPFTQSPEEQRPHPIGPSTPFSLFPRHCTASSPEPHSQRHPKKAPRHFYTSDKGSTPKGFKQLRKKPRPITPERALVDFLGDGFSESEATATGVTRVSRYLKPARTNVIFAQLDLAQSTDIQPEHEKEKRPRKARYIRARKRNRDEDNAFDSADIQLKPRFKRRREEEAPGSPESTTFPVGPLAPTPKKRPGDDSTVKSQPEPLCKEPIQPIHSKKQHGGGQVMKACVERLDQAE